MGSSRRKRIAVNVGEGYVPGLNAVFTGVVRAAFELEWEVMGIRDGFDGLLFPDRYEAGGMVSLTPEKVEHPVALSRGILGTTHPMDPFRAQVVDHDNQIIEKDLSDNLLERVEASGIDGIISVLGPKELGMAWKLARKGLPLVCVPKAVENDVAGTTLSFGFNSALSYVVETLERASTAAETLGRIAVVEVLGTHAGWLALQGGIALPADAVLIPEIPYHLDSVAKQLQKKLQRGWPVALVVVAEGASPAKSETPLLNECAHVMDRSGLVAESVALELQRRMAQETFPLVLGQLIRGGNPTAVDRQLAVGYGASAVRALKDGRIGVMTAFQPPDLTFVPLSEAVNRIRTVPLDSEFVQVARALGISLGD